MSPDSASWTGERGFKMVTSWLPMPVAVMLADRYRAAAAAAGHPTNPSMLGLRRRVFVADSDAEAQEKFAAARDLITGSLGGGFETPDPKVIAMMTHPDDFAIGSPETVAEKLIGQCRAGGYGVVMALTDTQVFSPADFARSHELIGRRVAPLLRAADVGAKASIGEASVRAAGG
jgi:alkanesulfonate monooxygenase SsuD/methylene tetrahydromethanopterin reductase-like flavin-dependent oxidoreductase (luciferase family)